MLRYFIIFTCGLLAAMLLMLSLRRLSLRHKVLYSHNVPLVGGLGLAMGFMLSLVLAVYLFGIFPVKIFALVGISLIILASGIIDDLKELSVAQKFLIQSFCAGLMIFFGIRTQIVYIGFWANAAITFVWILLITNAFNLLDIVDGLASGIALIATGAFLVLSFLIPDLDMRTLSLALFAANLGFLSFNLPPAKIYLGNSGSHFLGFLLSGMALISHYASLENVFALFSPIVILWLPITDTLLLVMFRVIKRKTPFEKSNDHIAFKITALGFSRAKMLRIMFLFSFISASAGIVLTKVNNSCAIGIIVGLVLFSLVLFLRLLKIDIHA